MSTTTSLCRIGFKRRRNVTDSRFVFIHSGYSGSVTDPSPPPTINGRQLRSKYRECINRCLILGIVFAAGRKKKQKQEVIQDKGNSSLVNNTNMSSISGNNSRRSGKFCSFDS